MKINITLHETRAQDAIARLIKSGSDMSPLMRDIGEKLLTRTRDRFADERDPNNKRWAPLSPNTIAKKRKNKDKILTERGYLFGSLTYQDGRDYVDIGSSMVYASTHQFGAKKGAFGKTGVDRSRPGLVEVGRG